MPRLPQETIERELDAIEGLIAKHPKGIRRSALEEEFEESQRRPIAWRTLLRRIDQLIEAGRARVEGSHRSAIYLPGPALVLEAPPPEKGYVPLTREGAQIRALVRRPIAERKPTGYDSTLLEAYDQKRTPYLPQTIRTRLHRLGRTPDIQRPAGTYAREIYSRLLIDLSWASSKLEGNTYTQLDTENLLEFGQAAEGKDAAEAQMILNHKAAIEFLVEQANEIGFDRRTFLTLHALLSENLLGDPANEGRLRTRSVVIGGTTYTPLAIPQKIEEYFQRLLDKAAAIDDPFEQAFFVMVHLPYLQPFADVNKRTSRLGANISLIRANLCPLSFVDVPQEAYVDGTLGVYELRRVGLLRDVFVWAYERSSAQYHIVREAIGQPDPLRIRYRSQLNDAVRDTIQRGLPPSIERLRAWATEHDVPEADADGFANTALGLLLGLNENSAARSGLRPSEFTAWRSRFPGSTTPQPTAQ